MTVIYFIRFFRVVIGGSPRMKRLVAIVLLSSAPSQLLAQSSCD